MLFELSPENTGFKALHFHGKAKQFKVGLLLALSKLPKQSMFQEIEWLGRVVTVSPSATICYVKILVSSIPLCLWW
jgi:hypothetical protein